jgi:hypothetical protein
LRICAVMLARSHLADLTEDQAAEWRAVVDRLPNDWFPRETHGMLAQFCRHVCTARPSFG